MYKHIGNIGEKLPANIFLSADFTKCRAYVIRMRIKSLTERFYTHLYTDEIYPDTDTDDKNSPNVIQLVHFLYAYAMWILILIRRRGLGPLSWEISHCHKI